MITITFPIFLIYTIVYNITPLLELGSESGDPHRPTENLRKSAHFLVAVVSPKLGILLHARHILYLVLFLFATWYLVYSHHFMV